MIDALLNHYGWAWLLIGCAVGLFLRWVIVVVVLDD